MRWGRGRVDNFPRGVRMPRLLRILFSAVNLVCWLFYCSRQNTKLKTNPKLIGQYDMGLNIKYPKRDSGASVKALFPFSFLWSFTLNNKWHQHLWFDPQSTGTRRELEVGSSLDDSELYDPRQVHLLTCKVVSSISLTKQECRNKFNTLPFNIKILHI